MFDSIKNKLKNKIRGITSIEELKDCGMQIGANFWQGDGCCYDWSFPWLITIGNNVTLSHGVDIIAHDASLQKVMGVTKLARVVIGDNVFVGANTTILPGTVIGNGSIIGAGSLVKSVIPENEVWAGCPARRICSVAEYVSRQTVGVPLDATGTMHKCDPSKANVKQAILEQIDKDGFTYIR